MRNLLVIGLILIPGLAQAQNVCDLTVAARQVEYKSTTTIALVSSQHNSSVGGVPVIDSYLGEILLNNVAVTNWTIPKTDLKAVTGLPTNCYQAPLPAFKEVLPTNMYFVRISARNTVGTGMPVVSIDSFFIQAAPIPLGGVRLVP